MHRDTHSGSAAHGEEEGESSRRLGMARHSLVVPSERALDTGRIAPGEERARKKLSFSVGLIPQEHRVSQSTRKGWEGKCRAAYLKRPLLHVDHEEVVDQDNLHNTKKRGKGFRTPAGNGEVVASRVRASKIAG